MYPFLPSYVKNEIDLFISVSDHLYVAADSELSTFYRRYVNTIASSNDDGAKWKLVCNS